MSVINQEGDHLSFFDGCVRTYGKATRLMSEVWEGASGEPMPKLSGSPKDRFLQALRQFEMALRAERLPRLKSDLHDAAATDPVLQSFIDESLQSGSDALAHDVDDVSPNLFKQAVYDEAAECVRQHETVDVNLDDFLRPVVGRILKEMGWNRRFNVGANRHFPRMIEWLREVQEETTYEEGIGVRLMNRSGTGRVPRRPDGPHTLKVRIASANL